MEQITCRTFVKRIFQRKFLNEDDFKANNLALSFYQLNFAVNLLSF